MTKKKKRKQPYFPNSVEALQDAPAEWFDSIPFDEFMDWKIHGYEIPSSVACIIRENNIKTGKVSEHIYQRESAAKKKAQKIMAEGESEFVLCTQDEVHHLYPIVGEKQETLYDDPFN
tara:strand:+ start:88 stop:441 length:354 start_codon:yes stop_codon:yes gene_type:complete